MWVSRLYTRLRYSEVGTPSWRYMHNQYILEAGMRSESSVFLSCTNLPPTSASLLLQGRRRLSSIMKSHEF